MARKPLGKYDARLPSARKGTTREWKILSRPQHIVQFIDLLHKSSMVILQDCILSITFFSVMVATPIEYNVPNGQHYRDLSIMS